MFNLLYTDAWYRRDLTTQMQTTRVVERGQVMLEENFIMTRDEG